MISLCKIFLHLSPFSYNFLVFLGTEISLYEREKLCFENDLTFSVFPYKKGLVRVQKINLSQNTFLFIMTANGNLMGTLKNLEEKQKNGWGGSSVPEPTLWMFQG